MSTVVVLHILTLNKYYPLSEEVRVLNVAITVVSQTKKGEYC